MAESSIASDSVSDVCSTASLEDCLKDDMPGVTGEIMFVNTDAFEECGESCDVQSSDLAGDPSAYNDQVSSELVSGMGSLATEDARAFAGDEFHDAEDLEALGEEYLTDTAWLDQEKHIFILSESGKPIYTRHGKEDSLVALFGLMQALVSFVADGDDIIRSVIAGNRKFVFLVRSPFIFVAVSRTSASVPQLMVHLSYLHSQIVSVSTSSTLTRMFEKRSNYDFRQLLGGTDRLLDNLTNLLDHHPSFLLGAIQCLQMTASTRENITQAVIHYCSKIKDLVFGLIVCNNQLISLVRMKKHLLHPADLHLLFNLIESTESLKTSENWMPICLPKFDSKGYLHGHVSYLSDDCAACLILLSVDREQFFVLSEAKQKIVERLRRNHCLEKINQAVQASSYMAKCIGCSDLRHFLYKSKSTAQYTCPEFTAPYNSAMEQKRLFGLYRDLHHRIHSSSRPLKMAFLLLPSEALLGWVTKEFELYVTMEPMVTKSRAVTCVNKILQWIKSEENKLFILSSPTF